MALLRSPVTSGTLACSPEDPESQFLEEFPRLQFLFGAQLFLFGLPFLRVGHQHHYPILHRQEGLAEYQSSASFSSSGFLFAGSLVVDPLLVGFLSSEPSSSRRTLNCRRLVPYISAETLVSVNLHKETILIKHFHILNTNNASLQKIIPFLILSIVSMQIFSQQFNSRLPGI